MRALRSLTIFLSVALAGLLFACIPGDAIAQPPPTNRLLVIPFPDVSPYSGRMPSPTKYLVAQLSASQLDVSEAPDMDPIVAATSATDLCTATSSTGLVLGTIQLTSTSLVAAPIGVVSVFFGNATTFTKDAVGATTGAIAASGLLSRTSIEARVKLYYEDCHGNLRWRTTTVAKEIHNGNNIGSGYTQIVERAIRQGVSEFTSSRDALSWKIDR